MLQDTHLADPTMPAQCAHCGEPCPNLILGPDERVFCCQGCRSVYEILQQNDLCSYYEREGAIGVSMRTNRVTNDHFAVLDDPGTARHLLVFASSELHRVIWTIPTLHCASCVWLLEQLNRLDTGVLASRVDILRKSLSVDFDPRRTTLRHIAETLSSIGYEPLLRLEGTDGMPLDRGTRAMYTRLGLAGFAAGNTMLMGIAQYLAGPGAVGPELRTTFDVISVLLSIPVLLYSAAPWFTGARSALRQRKLNLDVPVATGILVLFVRSIVDILGGHSEGYLDSFNGLVFFLLIGRLFQQKAFDALSFDRSYRSFFPLSVRVERSASLEVIPIEQVTLGDVLVVRNGEVVPCDSVLESEAGYIDYSFVTGESLPVESVKGSTIYAGGRVTGRALRLIAVKNVSHSELAAMWDRSSHRKERAAYLNLSDTFGRWFILAALVIAVLGALLWLPDMHMAFNVLTAVLIIACPCALTIAAPITLGTAMGRLGSLGIYLKNVGTLLELDRIDTIYFDKTGTLSVPAHTLRFEGRMLSNAEQEALRSVASHSAHPVSRAIAGDQFVIDKANVILEEIGQGLRGSANGYQISIGSPGFIAAVTGAKVQNVETVAAAVAVDGVYAGAFVIEPQLRPGVDAMIDTLRQDKQIRLISGDSERDRTLLAPLFGEEQLAFRQAPQDKVAEIERAHDCGHRVLMVGDGLNDAGAMNTSDVAIAVTDETATLVPACDVIMRATSLTALPSLLSYARRMKHTILASFIFSMVYNVIGLALAIMGLLSPLIAAIMMPASSILVIALSVGSARWNTRRSVWG